MHDSIVSLKREGKLCFAKDCKPIQTIDLEKHYFVSLVVIIDSGDDHQWIIRPVGKQTMGKRVFIQPHRFLGYLCITRSVFTLERSVSLHLICISSCSESPAVGQSDLMSPLI